MPETDPRNRRSTIFVLLIVVVVLFPLGYSAVSSLFAQDAAVPAQFLERPDAQYENCVRETTYMRFHHWELLREVRKEIVRYGRRGELGLAKCRECHTSRERFCDRCHRAASVILDCFGCHYYP